MDFGRGRQAAGDDTPWVKRAEKGDAQAWAHLVDSYGPYVQAVLRAARVPESEAADAFQHVFIELFKALGTLRQTQTLAPWLRQTALRHAIQLRKRAQGAPVSLSELDAEPMAPEEVSELEKAERRHHIREAVQGLKDQCRELVRRLFFSDPPEPYHEVAAALGIKESSLSMTRQRCLDALEKALRARGLE